MGTTLDSQSYDFTLSAVMDSTFTHAVYVESLPAAYTYDTDGNLATETRGPDQHNFSFRKTYTFTAGKLTAESAWVKL